jgi:cytochrome P450
VNAHGATRTERLYEAAIREIERVGFSDVRIERTRAWALDATSCSDADAVNPIVTGRLRRSDCCQITDGGAGIVLASLRALRSNVEGYIEATAHELIDLFVGDGHANLVPQFTFTFPLRIIARIIGVPIADFEAFHHWALALVSVADDPAKAFAAARSIVDYLRPILDERRASTGDDLLAALLNVEVEGERLSDEEVLSFLRLLLPAGAETTYRLVGNVLFALLTHPEQRAEVEANPELLSDFIEETLRWDSPVQIISREATRDVDLHGYRIPKGDLACFAIGSANRDERHYADPDRFDLHRADKGDHVSFGLGAHYCLGAHLARMETRIAVAAMLERLPNLRLEPAEACSIRGFAFRSPDRLPVRFG